MIFGRYIEAGMPAPVAAHPRAAAPATQQT
jgi:hypothetical protein